MEEERFMSEDLVTLITPPTEFEANILAIVLRENGIEANVFAIPTIGIGIPLSGGLPGVPLQVKSSDVEKARKILLENKRDSIDIDWDELEFSGSDEPYKGGGVPLLVKAIVVVVIMWIVVAYAASIFNFVFE